MEINQDNILQIQNCINKIHNELDKIKILLKNKSITNQNIANIHKNIYRNTIIFSNTEYIENISKFDEILLEWLTLEQLQLCKESGGFITGSLFFKFIMNSIHGDNIVDFNPDDIDIFIPYNRHIYTIDSLIEKINNERDEIDIEQHISYRDHKLAKYIQDNNEKYSWELLAAKFYVSVIAGKCINKTSIYNNVLSVVGAKNIHKNMEKKYNIIFCGYSSPNDIVDSFDLECCRNFYIPLEKLYYIQNIKCLINKTSTFSMNKINEEVYRTINFYQSYICAVFRMFYDLCEIDKSNKQKPDSYTYNSGDVLERIIVERDFCVYKNIFNAMKKNKTFIGLLEKIDKKYITDVDPKIRVCENMLKAMSMIQDMLRITKYRNRGMNIVDY